MKTCAKCEQVIDRRGRRGPAPTYCSAECKAAARQAREQVNGVRERAMEVARERALRERQERPTQSCPYCGDQMTHPRRVQCGKPECKRLWTNERNLEFQRKYKAETGEYYSRQYTYERTCEVCGTSWQAKTKAARYCSVGCTNKTRQYSLVCDACGGSFTSTQSRARWCASACPTKWGTCRIPDTHPVVVNSTPIPFDHPVRWPWYGKTCKIYIPDCRWCGKAFVTPQSAQVLCSRRCVRREAKEIRKAREYNAEGTFTWTEFMGLFLKFGRRCAYCRHEIAGQPEPDHVIPLSRGGANQISNILPACKSCNSSKNDCTPSEWQERRETRGMPPRFTAWDSSDPLYAHLVLREPSRDRRTNGHAA